MHGLYLLLMLYKMVVIDNPLRWMVKNIAQRPRRPINPYGLFFRENYVRLREKNPGENFGVISREVSKLWEISPTKMVYRERIRAARTEYKNNLEKYNKCLLLNKPSGAGLKGTHFILIIEKLIHSIIIYTYMYALLLTT